MNNQKEKMALVIGTALLVSALCGCSKTGEKALLDPKKPTPVTVWNYYNGDQLSAFETLVNEFNTTIGAEKGIVVTSVSQGSIGNLAESLMDSVNGKVGAADIPSLAAIYSETVYILNKNGSIVPLDPYFTKEELDEYVPAFLDEGRLKQDGELLLFPVSKSTEALVVDDTDWSEFAAATGTTLDSIQTCEDLTAAAKCYYEWTDSRTPDIADDGLALYGRDSIANYIYLGTAQLGHEMFTVDSDGKVTVDMDRDTFKTLWDNYYIPYINGYFGSYGSYRSEDIKTGSILAMTGSTSGVSYIPTVVTTPDDVSHEIEVVIRPALSFENAKEPIMIQQGAGYCVMKTSEAEEYASAEFLKWFTDTEQNLNFSISSGYSPVKKEANDKEKIKEAFTVDSAKGENMLDALLLSAEVYNSGNTYISKAFEGSKALRDAVGDALEDTSVNDRAAVRESIEAGASHDDAVAPFITDEYFDKWFADLCSQVEAIIS